MCSMFCKINEVNQTNQTHLTINTNFSIIDCPVIEIIVVLNQAPSIMSNSSTQVVRGTDVNLDRNDEKHAPLYMVQLYAGMDVEYIDACRFCDIREGPQV